LGGIPPEATAQNGRVSAGIAHAAPRAVFIPPNTTAVAAAPPAARQRAGAEGAKKTDTALSRDMGSHTALARDMRAMSRDMRPERARSTLSVSGHSKVARRSGILFEEGSCSKRDPVRRGVLFEEGSCSKRDPVRRGILFEEGSCSKRDPVRRGILFEEGSCSKRGPVRRGRRRRVLGILVGVAITGRGLRRCRVQIPPVQILLVQIPLASQRGECGVEAPQTHSNLRCRGTHRDRRGGAN
jgi:hypothetical protein